MKPLHHFAHDVWAGHYMHGNALGNVPSFDVTRLIKGFEKSCLSGHEALSRAGIKESDYWRCRLLLRLCRKRPRRCRPAEERDELTS
jgi:hypothetical protein